MRSKGLIVSVSAVSFLVMYCAFLGMPSLPAADTWWHIACGEYLCHLWLSGSTSFWMAGDPFSFADPVAGPLVWVNHEWLAEILFYVVSAQWGIGALFIARTVCIILVFVAIPVAFSRKCGANLEIVTVVLAVCASCAEPASFFDVRAYLFTYLGLSLSVCGVLLIRRGLSGRYALLLVAMEMIWCNLHGGFILGICVACVVGVVWLLCDANERVVGSRACWLICAGGLSVIAAGLSSPYGFGLYRFSFSLVSSSVYSIGLNEWGPPMYLHSLGLWILAIVALLCWKRSEWPERVLLAAFGVAMFSVWRHAPLAAIVYGLIACNQLPEFEYSTCKRVRISAWIALTLVFAVLGGGRACGGVARLSMEGQLFPCDAVRFLNANRWLSKRLFNPYEWGGYLEYRLGTLHEYFIDGRANMLYPDERYAEALYLQYGENWLVILQDNGLASLLPSASCDRARIEAILDRSRIEVVLASKILGNLPERLMGVQGWQVVYEDELSFVFVKDSCLGGGSGEDIVYPITVRDYRARALQAFREGRIDAGKLECENGLMLSCGDSALWSLMGFAYEHSGKPGCGIGCYLHGLAIDPGQRDCWSGLGNIAHSSGLDWLAQWFWQRESNLSH